MRHLAAMALAFFCLFSVGNLSGNEASLNEKAAARQDQLWIETNDAINSGKTAEAVGLLRMCIRAGLQVAEAENLLRGYLASEAAQVRREKSLSDLPPEEMSELLRLQTEICSFKSSTADEWLQLLEIATSAGEERFIIAGEALLDRIEIGMPVKVNATWINHLKKLEKALSRPAQILYRLQLHEILAQIEATAPEFRPGLENMRILARAGAGKILDQADVAMALGDLEAARKNIQQVRDFEPQYPGLGESEKRFARAAKIRDLIGQAGEAMRERLFLKARALCREIYQLDAGNAFARATLQQIEDISSRGATAKIESEEARIELAVRRFEADLRRAEQDQDVLRIRNILKELLLLRNDNPDWVERLAAVENQIAVSSLRSEENLKKAVELLENEKYNQLRLFLNQNPGLMNSVETMVQVWEMRLMANFYTGQRTVEELKEAAAAIIARSGQSFYASFVMMKLALAENRIEEAQKHYLKAAEIQPKNPKLKWPGLLLWAHGSGRPVVVVVLVILFFVMIKLLRPLMAFYESTYWFRIAILARIFPSLALRSLEGCFGIYTERSDRIKLFRLLVACSAASKNSAKATLYANNLYDLAPHDPLAKPSGNRPAKVPAVGSNDDFAAAAAAATGMPASPEKISQQLEDKTLKARQAGSQPGKERLPEPPVVEAVPANLQTDQSAIKKRKLSLFAELDEVDAPAEISEEWRQALQQQVSFAALFPEILADKGRHP